MRRRSALQLQSTHEGEPHNLMVRRSDKPRGKSCATVKTHVLCLETETGLKGWGEVCPIPHYLPAFADGVPSAIREMAPNILGITPTGIDAPMRKLDKVLPGHLAAKSIVDMALWDLYGKATDLPLYQLLGGRTRRDMPLYHSITCIEPTEMARIATEAYATGIRQFQVKLGADADWQADAERIAKVREAVGDGPLVYGDWNCGASKLHATRTGRAVAHLDVMLEQPCKTLEDCADVRKATGLPMKIDEGVFDLASLDIVTAASLHFAASTPRGSLLNTCDLSGYVAPRIAPDCPLRQDGRIAPPEGAGLGVTPDLDILGTSILELD